MTDSPLADSFGRRIEYLRLSVTGRCNYRCTYCMPAAHCAAVRRKDELRDIELLRLVRSFAELGVRKIRLTGGEPLARRGIVRLAGDIARLPGIDDLSLSTNGHLLARHAMALRDAGVRRVNISLDSLIPATFARITRSGDLAAVLQGIDAAIEAGLHPIKLNMVVLKGINDHEIEDMLEFAQARGAHLRFIETMPVGEAGAASMAHHYPAHKMLERVRDHCGSDLIPVKGGRGAGPARYYQLGDSSARVGVISAISRHFCEGCNRVRLTARGDLVLCLGQQDRVALGAVLRAGASDDEIKREILAAIARKPERHDFLENAHAIRLPMSALGG